MKLKAANIFGLKMGPLTTFVKHYSKTHIIKNISMKQNKCITKTCLFKYNGSFTTKNWKILDKKIWYFHISAQNIDCGYSLEPPRRGGSNEYPQSMFWAEINKIMYTPVNPSFTI